MCRARLHPSIVSSPLEWRPIASPSCGGESRSVTDKNLIGDRITILRMRNFSKDEKNHIWTMPPIESKMYRKYHDNVRYRTTVAPWNFGSYIKHLVGCEMKKKAIGNLMAPLGENLKFRRLQYRIIDEISMSPILENVWNCDGLATTWWQKTP